jgi:hypothetical protein
MIPFRLPTGLTRGMEGITSSLVYSIAITLARLIVDRVCI